MPTITYPDVPPAPGVPPLLRAPGGEGDPGFDTPELLQTDGPSLGSDPGFPQWAIMQGVNVALVPDSMVAVDFAKDWNVSDYPTEEGAFESYNKVERPYDLRVTVSKGGTISDRADFLEIINAIENSLLLYTIVTPERTYENGNLIHVDYRRTAGQGAGLIVADLHFQEIRVTATAAYSSTNTKSPTASGEVDGGAVQGQPPTPVQKAAIVPTTGR